MPKKNNQTKSRNVAPSQRKTRRRRARNRAISQTLACRLSPAAAAYAKALADPADGPMVGIPFGAQILSNKRRLFLRGNATSGSTSPLDLSVLIQPFNALFSDRFALAVKQPTTSLQTNADLTGGGSMNAPYAASSFDGSHTTGRLVSFSFRIRPTQPALTLGGSIILGCHPNHTGIHSTSVGTMLSHPSFRRWNLNSMTHGEWAEVNYLPSDPQDVAYIDKVTSTTTLDGVLSADGVNLAWDAYPFMGGYIQCSTASTTFEWECYAIVEYAGPNVTGKTVNHPDPQGFGCVLAAANLINENSGATSGTSSHKDSGESRLGIAPIPDAGNAFFNALHHKASELLAAATPVVLNSAANYIGQRLYRSGGLQPQPMILEA